MVEVQKGQEQTLLKQLPQDVLDWIQRAWSGQYEVPETFNWLGVAEVAGTMANLHADIEWAEVAIRIYEWLADQRSNASFRHSELSSAMSLRSSMIHKHHKTVPGHYVLDPQFLVRWFSNELEWNYDEVAEKTRNWRALPFEQILILRHIKNRLSQLKHLVNDGYLQPDNNLQTWLALYPEFP